MYWLFSVRTQLIVAMSLCVVGAALAWWCFTGHQNTWQHWLACWLVVVNIITFLYYGLDKFLAIRLWMRIPEAVLHTLSAIGGSVAALLAMWLFRHKTIKASFRIFFWAIVVLQLCLSAYVAKLLWWN